jgi:hypothetical protein
MELTCKCLWDNDLQSFYGSQAGGESGWRHWPLNIGSKPTYANGPASPRFT